mgnify:CR=1 FL=1
MQDDPHLDLPAAPLTITGKSRVMFIMGDPITQVVGTAALNAHWTQSGRDLVTVPLHTQPDDLEHMLGMLRRSKCVAGTGVTVPHKIAAYRLVDRLTTAARQIGSVNFIRRDPDGSLVGHNIDGAGFLAGLKGAGVALQGRSVDLAGAGGVARAIAFALVSAGVRHLVLRNRDSARAEGLARDLHDRSDTSGCDIAVHEAETAKPADMLVNGTSLGMRAADPLPFTPGEIEGAKILAEVVMTPAETPFLAQGRAAGLTCVPGMAMLTPQADLVARFLDGDPA